MELLEAKDFEASAVADALTRMSHTICNVNLHCFPKSSFPPAGEVADMLSPSFSHDFLLCSYTDYSTGPKSKF